MTRFKLALLLGFALGWAVGSGRAQELLRRVRNSPDGQVSFDGSTAASSALGSGFGHQATETARVVGA
jgi:hypothetical protein